MSRPAHAFLVLSLIAMLVSACGDAAPTNEKPASASPLVSQEGLVRRGTFEANSQPWPLTVDQGRLGCAGNAAFIEVNGRRYGLNGFATAERGFAELEAIWAADEEMLETLDRAGARPTTYTPRINIGQLINLALERC